MDPAGISVSRTLPIDSALLSDVFLRLRRDSTTPALRWTLGERGVAEVEIAFTSSGQVWTTAARLWSGSGLAVTAATVRCLATGPDEVRLTLEPTLPPAPAWGHQGRQMLDLVRATVDELAEELLWHATPASGPRKAEARKGAFIFPSHSGRLPETRTGQDGHVPARAVRHAPPGVDGPRLVHDLRLRSNRKIRVSGSGPCPA